MKSYHPITWQEKQAKFVRYEIETLIAPLSDIASIKNLLNEALTRGSSGVSLETQYDMQWALLPIMVYEAISGYSEQAVPVSAAIRLLMAAGEVFDDIEDDDSSESLSARHSSAVATNVATTLLILAERAITQLKGRGVEDSTIVRIVDTINSHYVTACAGQHLDLSITPESAFSEDMYLKVAGMKSASTPECACHVGALLATENQELINGFTLFGYNLGITSQIANDIQGITKGNDIAKRKITLPVIYALAQTDGDTRNQLELAYIKSSESILEPEQIKDMLFNHGAIQYAVIKMEFYKQQAVGNLTDLEKNRVVIERLKLLLE